MAIINEKGLDFKAEAGEIIGVIGKNGAGKPTFLESIPTSQLEEMISDI